MKKIYMILAAITLLTMSLNAQDGAKKPAQNEVISPAPKLTATASNQAHSLTATSKASNFSFTDMLRGIKGMSSVLSAGQSHANSSANGQSRAPLKLNSDEVTVGPFQGDNFSTNGLGFPTAYGDNYQQIYITTELDRNEFIDYNGEEIVGFRFALAGNSSQTAVLYDFIAWPYSDEYFSQNRYTWSIPEYTGATPITSFDDIVITTNAGTSTNFRSITVYDQSNNVLTSWDYTGNTSTVTSGSNTYTYYVMPDGWTLSNVYLFQYGSGSSAVGYLSTNSTGSITISKDLLAGSSSVRVVISVYSDNGTETLDVNGDTQTIPTTSTNSFTYNFSPTGTSAPVYVELTAGQWYDCYLDQPIVFNVADSITGMRMGYRYFQYPSTETSELLYPIAVNPNSTSHNHVSYMVKQNGTTTGSQLLTGWDYATDVRNFPSTWTVPSMGNGSISGSLYFGNASGANIVIPASDLQGLTNVTVKVTAGKENTNTHSLTVNGTATSSALTTSLLEYTWENVNASNGITIHVSDWFVDISKIEVYGVVSVPNYQSGWWLEDFSQYGDLAVQLIFKKKTPVLTAPEDGSTVNVGTNEGSGVSTTIPVSGENLTENLTVTVSGAGFSVTPATISAADANAGTATVTVTYTGTDPNATGTLTISSGEVSATVNLTASSVQVNPTIAISPATQTINDANAGALTVTGTDITGNINVSAANDWSLTPTTLSNTGGQVSVSYTGRALSASTTVTASATGATDATATVNYVADLYIVTDNGVTGQWDFTNGTHMTYDPNTGTYTATFTANADNTFILFARMLGNDVNWNTRYVFGPDSNGDWWLPADGNGGGNLDLNDDDPIKIQYGGTYTITINANDGTFTITSGGTPLVPVLITPEDGSTVFVGTTSVEEPSVSKEIPISGHYLTKNLTATITGEGFSFLTRDVTVPYADVNAATASVTVVYSGTDENATGTLTLSSDEVSAVVNLTASYHKPVILTTVPAGYVAQDSKTPNQIVTAVFETPIDLYHGVVVSVTYVNSLGMTSDTPFEGVNIVVTRYSDGTTSTSKVIK